MVCCACITILLHFTLHLQLARRHIGAVGYCCMSRAYCATSSLTLSPADGAKLTFWNAFSHKIKVAAVNHPSLLEIPSDLEKMKESGVPLLINSCEVDAQFPKEAQAKADEVFGDSANYKVRIRESADRFI